MRHLETVTNGLRVIARSAQHDEAISVGSVPYPSGLVEKAVGIVIASPALGRRNLAVFVGRVCFKPAEHL